MIRVRKKSLPDGLILYIKEQALMRVDSLKKKWIEVDRRIEYPKPQIQPKKKSLDEILARICVILVIAELLKAFKSLS